MPWVWVGIGSNQAREASIRGAVHALRGRFGELTLSRVYECPAVGFAGEPFYNLVAGFATAASVAELAATLRAIEDAHARVRGPDKFAPRTLDLDLLTYGEAVGTIDGLILPRDEILRFAFVLGPLAEVAAEERHPACGRTYGELWAHFDQSAVPLTTVDLNLD